ncbi:MAG: hypothetical protein Tsb009_09380 [Planctomycetaceae bacterium]
MIQNIDFLPQNYRRKKKHKHSLRWRRVILVLFFALAVAGSLRQRQTRTEVEKQRDLLRSQVASLEKQLTNPQILHARIEHLDRVASLRANLKINTQPTSLLTSITTKLPRHVSLTEYQHIVETKRQNRTGLQKPRQRSTSPAASLAAEEKDLKELSQKQKHQVVSVFIKGLAKDDFSISRFLNRLQSDAAFQEVQLLYTGEETFQNWPMRGFRIRLQIRQPAPQQKTNQLAALENGFTD